VFIDLFAPKGHRNYACFLTYITHTHTHIYICMYRKEEQAKIKQASYKLVMKICCFVVAV